MTKLCFGQGNPDADDNKDDDAADAATANESNPYMSPFQVTQKQNLTCVDRGWGWEDIKCCHDLSNLQRNKDIRNGRRITYHYLSNITHNFNRMIMIYLLIMFIGSKGFCTLTCDYIPSDLAESTWPIFNLKLFK